MIPSSNVAGEGLCFYKAVEYMAACDDIGFEKKGKTDIVPKNSLGYPQFHDVASFMKWKGNSFDTFKWEVPLIERVDMGYIVEWTRKNKVVLHMWYPTFTHGFALGSSGCDVKNPTRKLHVLMMIPSRTSPLKTCGACSVPWDSTDIHCSPVTNVKKFKQIVKRVYKHIDSEHYCFLCGESYAFEREYFVHFPCKFVNRINGAAKVNITS